MPYLCRRKYLKPKFKIMTKFLLSLAILLSALYAQAKNEPAPVFLVAGQSNTDGRVPNDELPQYIRQGQYKHCHWSYGSGTLSGNGRFEPFWPKTALAHNPDRWAYDAVVNYFLDQSLGQDFYVIKESLGGTSIDPGATSNGGMHWSADPAFLDSTAAADKGGKSLLKAFTDNIGACIDNKLSKLEQGYEIKALIWHQGESDNKVGQKYHKNLKDVIAYIRKYLVEKTGDKKYAGLPVIVGGIVHSGKGWSNQVGLAQIRLANEDKNVHLVDVHDATLRADNLHFDAAGAELLGRKVYNELVALGLAGGKASPVPYSEHSRLVKVGSGGAMMFADLPDAATKPARAVVALPGGGYDHLAISHEGTLWAKYFNDRGLAYFTLIYRMPDGDRTIPIGDAEAAIKMVRDSAEAWNIDPNGIGIMGSSAGGHLASTIATHAAKACRPDFQILFYPVITFVGKTHGGSRRHLLGKEADNEALCREYSNELHVKRGDTPPAVVILAKNDMAVPPASNGVAYYNALKAAGIPATLIEYDEGGHGFGFKKSFKYHDQLLHDLGEWLK